LILGYYADGMLQYAGRTGTGFTRNSAREVFRTLAPLRRKTTPFKTVPEEERGARRPLWVEPSCVAEVEFRGWTHGQRLRHASFKGLRDDKDAREVVRERSIMPAPTDDEKTPQNSAGRAGAKHVGAKAIGTNSPADFPLTHPERVYWEDAGVTKRDLAAFYAGIWPWIEPHVANRALSLVRCPQGASGQCFFQKHASAGIDTKHLLLVPEDGDTIIAIDRIEGLLSLVQAGVLEVHVRGSTIARLDDADRIVFDLDPGPDVPWSALISAARDVKARLEALKLASYLKTTGGKGLHVVLPIAPAPWDAVKTFARDLASAMAADDPSRYLATATKAARGGKIYVDYLRNSREATAICAYSTRARPGAPVSVPIAWTELGSIGSANRYTVLNLAQRLARLKHDPWKDIAAEKQKLPTVKVK
ncbi:MAG: DNA ligase D, partial [Rhizobiales bacterium]|nr:DNA ligase D [Hyphomicrobiales bacterium]